MIQNSRKTQSITQTYLGFLISKWVITHIYCIQKLYFYKIILYESFTSFQTLLSIQNFYNLLKRNVIVGSPIIFLGARSIYKKYWWVLYLPTIILIFKNFVRGHRPPMLDVVPPLNMSADCAVQVACYTRNSKWA